MVPEKDRYSHGGISSSTGVELNDAFGRDLVVESCLNVFSRWVGLSTASDMVRLIASGSVVVSF